MSDTTVTQMLLRARDGDDDALKSVYAILITELEQAARAQLRRRQGQPTLQTHALINESFLKLVEQSEQGLQNRAHFLAVASTAMRHVLIDHFRSKTAQKRGGIINAAITLVEGELAAHAPDDQVLALDEALTKLQQTNQRLAQIVECKFFGGMTYEEIAEAVGLSPRTIRKDWKKAKAWLTLELNT